MEGRIEGAKDRGNNEKQTDNEINVKQDQYDSKMRIGIAKTDISMATKWNLSKIVMIKWNKHRHSWINDTIR